MANNALDMFRNQRPANDTSLNFSEDEWMGLVIAGDTAATASLIANSIVLIIHSFMLWYRPAVVARLSLRMIVLSCIFNIFYCAGQLVTDEISSQAYSCRVLIYVLIVSDTMACMCLAMVGLNLVMIFVLRVSRSVKLEVIYYMIIAVCGVLVAVVPISVNRRVRPNPTASCWYHYYFDGRLRAVFNWLWYYCWLMFSSVFAAFCAVISLAFVLKKQGNLTGSLDVFSLRDKDQASKIQKLKYYSKNNTDVFKKIAKRCVLYPLVPLISKSWGISIVITSACNGTVPYAIFVIDRVFGCLLGLMVSCIYYTDPALKAVFKEGIDTLKKRYVYDYYTVRYQPNSDPATAKSKGHYPERVKIKENLQTPATSPAGITMGLDYDITHEEIVGSPDFLGTSYDNLNTNNGSYRTNRNTSSNVHPHASDPRRPSVSFKLEVPSVEVRKPLDESSKNQTENSQRRFSVISVTSVNGKTFSPHEKILENTKHSWKDSLKSQNKFQTIPMRRVSGDETTASERKAIIAKSPLLSDNGNIETIVPYKHPRGAKFMHWVLVYIFRVSPTPPDPDEEEQDTPPARVFRDFTDNSNPTSPQLSSAPAVHSTPVLPVSLNLSNLDLQHTSSPVTKKHRKTFSEDLKSPPPRAYSSDVVRGAEEDSDDIPTEFPLRKVSTINIGSMYRNKDPLSHLPAVEKSSNKTSPISGFGLAKLFNREKFMPNSLGVIPRSSSKRPISPTSPKSFHVAPASMDNLIPMKSIANNGNSSQVRREENIRKQALTRDIRTTSVVEKPASIHSNVSIKCPFPSELSPRPITKSDANVGNSLTNLRQGSFSSSTTKKSNLDSVAHFNPRLSIFGEESIQPNDGEMQNTEGSANSSDIIQRNPLNEPDFTSEKRISVTSELTTFEDYENRLSLVSDTEIAGDQDGLSQGFTAISFISNWQDHDSDDSTRIVVHAEAWDIEEQFRAQIALAEAMEHV